MSTSESVVSEPAPRVVLPSVASVVAQLEGEVTGVRRDIHRHPELSYEEYRTTDRIVEALAEHGLSPVRLQDTGAYVDVGEGPIVLALRADIDALPVEEETSLPYVSVNDGVAHACGHDMHTAVMVGTALTLARILRGATPDPALRSASSSSPPRSGCPAARSPSSARVSSKASRASWPRTATRTSTSARSAPASAPSRPRRTLYASRSRAAAATPRVRT